MKLKKKTQHHRLSPEAVAAWKANDDSALEDALCLPPWHMSPFAALEEPPLDDHTAYSQSWATARELRLELEEAAKE